MDMGIWKIAAVQMDVRLGEPAHNLEKMIRFAEKAVSGGAQLVAFPECALTGYCFENKEEAQRFAEPIPGPSTARLSECCRNWNCYVAFGMLEQSDEGLFNACALVGPQGVVGAYRKVHLPYLGVDRFATPGNRPFAVLQADSARLGLHICYDGSFPESARVMALLGADILLLPTNWPPGAENTAAYVVNTRALENHVYYVAVNRVGQERGFRFIGQSRICDPTGTTLAEADAESETILYAEADLEFARTKRIVRVPGKHIIDRFADRRPAFYTTIVEPIDRPPPRS